LIQTDNKNNLNITIMKHALKTITSLLIFSQLITAQNNATFGQDIRFGTKAGLNGSNFSGDTEGNSTRISFHLGGFAEFMINEEFAVQPELLFSAQGSNFDEFNSVLTYLTLPIMGKYFVDDKIHLEFGPQICFLLSAKLKDFPTEDFGGGGTVDQQSKTTNISAKMQDVDIKETVKSLDFGVSFGGGYMITEQINLGLRYYLGLSNFNDTNQENSTLRNSVFQLSVSYFLN